MPERITDRSKVAPSSAQGEAQALGQRLQLSEPAGGPQAPARPDDAPRCSRCNASLVDSARYRSVIVPPGPREPPGQASLVVRVVYCSNCGTTVGSSLAAISSLDGGPALALSLAADLNEPVPAASVRHFPDQALTQVILEEVPADSKVELTWTDRRILDGHAGRAQVQLLGQWSPEGNIEGAWLDEPLSVSWEVSSSASTPLSEHLAGKLGTKTLELDATLHLDQDLSFNQGEVAGNIGGQDFRARVTPVEGGHGSKGAVAAEGKLGEVPFEVLVDIFANARRASVRGAYGDTSVRLDAIAEDDLAPLRIAGEYTGPPELLAVVTCAALYFI